MPKDIADAYTWLCGTQPSSRCFQGSGACGKGRMKKNRGRTGAEKDNEERREKEGRSRELEEQKFNNVEIN